MPSGRSTSRGSLKLSATTLVQCQRLPTWRRAHDLFPQHCFSHEHASLMNTLMNTCTLMNMMNTCS
eukprot:984433-Rhodomonas_salina.2